MNMSDTAYAIMIILILIVAFICIIWNGQETKKEKILMCIKTLCLLPFTVFMLLLHIFEKGG